MTWPSRVTASRVAGVTSAKVMPSRAMQVVQRQHAALGGEAAQHHLVGADQVERRVVVGETSAIMCSNMVSIEPTPTLSQDSSVAIPVSSLKRRRAAGRFWNGHQSSW